MDAKDVEGIGRRNFLKYSGLALGASLTGLRPQPVFAAKQFGHSIVQQINHVKLYMTHYAFFEEPDPGVPNAVYFALGAVIVTTLIVKRTVPGRRFEAVGANAFAAWTTGLRIERYRGGAYVWAAVLYWLAGFLLAGIINKPTAYQGDSYILASVAAVVLGGTSLLGGRGNLVATFVAALFLTQLQQFVLALGVTFAVQTLVQAAALTVGVALYAVDWARLRPRRRSRLIAAPA